MCRFPTARALWCMALWCMALWLLQHWEGDPDAINSVRREQKPRSLQMEELNFARSRRYDTKNESTRKNEPTKSTLPPVLSSQNSSSKLTRTNSSQCLSTNQSRPSSAQSKLVTGPTKPVSILKKTPKVQTPNRGRGESTHPSIDEPGAEAIKKTKTIQIGKGTRSTNGHGSANSSASASQPSMKGSSLKNSSDVKSKKTPGRKSSLGKNKVAPN